MYLISGNIEKCFVMASWFAGRTMLITPSKSYVVDVVTFSNCKMVVEEFSSSPRMSCSSPIYSYRGWTRLLVIGQRMSFWHLADRNWFLHLTETTTIFGHVASPCWSWMSSHYDTWHEFGLQVEWTFDLNLIKKNDLIT